MCVIIFFDKSVGVNYIRTRTRSMLLSQRSEQMGRMLRDITCMHHSYRGLDNFWCMCVSDVDDDAHVCVYYLCAHSIARTRYIKTVLSTGRTARGGSCFFVCVRSKCIQFGFKFTGF